jgi:RNA polymerase sigma-70 factor (ECF subfamily)
MADMIQEVFVCLFEQDARVLRAWAPSRGLSLENFVGLVAERQVTSLMRSGKRNPWTEDPTADGEMDSCFEAVGSPHVQVASRESLQLLVDKLRERLSPLGLGIFYALVVEEREVDDVCTTFGMTADAVYAWRSRLARLVRSLATDLDSIDSMSELAEPDRMPVGANDV